MKIAKIRRINSQNGVFRWKMADDLRLVAMIQMEMDGMTVKRGGSSGGLWQHEGIDVA